jgi:hypothetical protein
MLFIGVGRVLLDGSDPPGAAPQMHGCDAGSELELAAELMRATPRLRYDVLLGSGWYTLVSVPRVAGVWSAAERNRAALGLARLDPAHWHVVAIDPSPRSAAWLMCALRSDRYAALSQWRSRSKSRVTSIAAWSAAVLSALPATGAERQLTAVIEEEDIVWSVQTSHSLIAAGQVRTIARDRVPLEVDRIALAHGVAGGKQRRLIELGASAGAGDGARPDARLARVPLSGAAHLVDVMP